MSISLVRALSSVFKWHSPLFDAGIEESSEVQCIYWQLSPIIFRGEFFWKQQKEKYASPKSSAMNIHSIVHIYTIITQKIFP